MPNTQELRSQQDNNEAAGSDGQVDLRPRGRHVIKVCVGGCRGEGGEQILEALSEELGIGPGETTEDRRFTLETAECLDACDRAPAVMIDDQIFGRLTPEEAVRLLERFE